MEYIITDANTGVVVSAGAQNFSSEDEVQDFIALKRADGKDVHFEYPPKLEAA